MIILKNEINIAFPQVPYENLKEKLTMFIKNEVDNFLDFAKENKYIQYTINGKNYLYKIFSVSIVEEDRLLYNTDNYSKAELKTYIDDSLQDSFYDFDVDVDENDNIITLATCTRFYGATAMYTYKIDARMVRDGEKIKNYSVKENKNYDKIKKTMEGGEKNEKEI